jgi:hypothetical protein
MIGEDYELSILAPHWPWEAGAAVFELWDGEISYLLGSRDPDTPASRDSAHRARGAARGRARQTPRARSRRWRRRPTRPTPRAGLGLPKVTREWYTQVYGLVQRLSEEFGIRVDEPAKAVRTLGHTSFPHRTPPPDPVRLRHDRSETLAKKFLPD